MALARVEMWLPLGFSANNSQGHSGLVDHPPHTIHLALRLLHEQVAPNAVHEYFGDFTRVHHVVSSVIAEAVSSMMGWLESGLDFHVPKDEEGPQGSSLIILASSGALNFAVGCPDEGVGHEGGLARKKILGIGSFGVGAKRRRKTKYGRPAKTRKRMSKVKLFTKYGAITSKIAKAGLMPSGLHGMRCVDRPPTRVNAFGTTVVRCLPGKHARRSLTWRLAVHAIHACRIESIVVLDRGSLE